MQVASFNRRLYVWTSSIIVLEFQVIILIPGYIFVLQFQVIILIPGYKIVLEFRPLACVIVCLR